MNRLKNTGLVLCGLVLGLSLSAPAAQAVESLKATLSTNRILDFFSVLPDRFCSTSARRL